MGTTTNNGFRYPAATDPPDGPGGLFNLASDVDAALISGTWTPVLGGTGASSGSGATIEGTYTRTIKGWQFNGTFLLGSGASFGSGTAAINLPVNLKNAVGTGFYLAPTGSPVFLGLYPSVAPASASGSTYYFGLASNGAQLFTIGTPPSGARLQFLIDGYTP
jgi:hypothetical protein